MKNTNSHEKHPWGTVWYDSHGERIADTLHDTGKVYLTLFDRDEVYAGAATTVRDAYREAYRRLRLGRHDTAKLLRERAALQAAIAKQERHDSDAEVRSRPNRRARMALAIRAHHAALDEQAARYEESLRTTRRALIERTKERGELVAALGIVLREIAAARENNPYVRLHIPDVTSGKTEDLIAAVRALCDLAAEYDALHRRATSAEQRVEDWRRTVERLEAEIARS